MHSKQELREMSRKQALRVVREVLATYRARLVSGRITIDVRSGRAIWVKPVVADDIGAPGIAIQEEMVFMELEQALRRFQRRGVSGTITLVVYKGRGVRVETVVEWEKVRVG